jgi:phytoene dehydrogenase-like protein
MQRIFMMNQDGRMSHCFMLISSITDKSAPEGMESVFFLVPLAPGINDTEALREEYFEKIMNRFESVTKQSVKKNIIFKSHFARTILFQNIIHTKECIRNGKHIVTNCFSSSLNQKSKKST